MHTGVDRLVHENCKLRSIALITASAIDLVSKCPYARCRHQVHMDAVTEQTFWFSRAMRAKRCSKHLGMRPLFSGMMAPSSSIKPAIVYVLPEPDVQVIE